MGIIAPQFILCWEFCKCTNAILLLGRLHLWSRKFGKTIFFQPKLSHGLWCSPTMFQFRRLQPPQHTHTHNFSNPNYYLVWEICACDLHVVVGPLYGWKTSWALLKCSECHYRVATGVKRPTCYPSLIFAQVPILATRQHQPKLWIPITDLVCSKFMHAHVVICFLGLKCSCCLLYIVE